MKKKVSINGQSYTLNYSKNPEGKVAVGSLLNEGGTDCKENLDVQDGLMAEVIAIEEGPADEEEEE